MKEADARISILGLGLALLVAWAPIARADTYTYTFNAANQLTSVQAPSQAASFTYDGDGQRITKTTAAGQTIYVRDPQGQVIAEYSSTGQLLAEYVYVDGQRLCKITHDTNNVEHRVYYHADMLGTPVAETNESGQVLVRAQYYPFGEEVIQGAAPDPHKFTGKELDDEIGLYYFGARYYDAHLGRFVSVDPVGGKNADPQSWNRYVYGRDNPLKLVDPDGLETYLVVYGRGYLATDLRGQGHDVGGLFRAAAETRKAQIEASPTFHAGTDKVELRGVGTAQKFIQVMNTKYEKGAIASVDVYSHGYPGGLNFGEGLKGTLGKLFQTSDVANLTPNFAPGATMTLFGCNTAAPAAPGSPSIAQALSQALGIPVSGSSSYTMFTNTKPTPDNPAVEVVPQGGQMVTFTSGSGTTQ